MDTVDLFRSLKLYFGPAVIKFIDPHAIARIAPSTVFQGTGIVPCAFIIFTGIPDAIEIRVILIRVCNIWTIITHIADAVFIYIHLVFIVFSRTIIDIPANKIPIDIIVEIIGTFITGIPHLIMVSV